MKRTLLLLAVCLLLSAIGNAQTKKPIRKTTKTRTTQSVNVPVQPSANGKFKFTRLGFKNTSDEKDYVVITIEGKSTADIKSSVVSSLSSMYSNPNKVISIIGDNLINVTAYAPNVFIGSFAGNNVYYSFTYNIKIEIKDGKIKVDAPAFSNITAREVYMGQTLRNDYIDTSDLYYELSKTLEQKQAEVANFFNSHITKIVSGLSNSDW